MTCKNRVKPKLLRDIKTEALLVFIRTTLEQSFYQIDNIGYNFRLGNDEDNDIVYSSLKKLLEQLQDTVINSTYLRSLIENAHKNATLKVLAKKEEPLMVYYDILIKTIEVCLPNGSFWIPELVVISLLSEWIIEEEKSTYFYPFLKDLDYIDLINRYDNAKIGLDKDKKEIMLNMYKISSTLIEKLKNRLHVKQSTVDTFKALNDEIVHFRKIKVREDKKEEFVQTVSKTIKMQILTDDEVFKLLSNLESKGKKSRLTEDKKIELDTELERIHTTLKKEHAEMLLKIK